MSLSEQLLDLAKAKAVTIATAESCTAGMIAAAITDTPGSSAIFDRGFVTYSNRAKIDMLGVTTATLDVFGAVSEEVAQEMAKGALSRSEAQIAVSVTGIAGPGGSEHKPEGRVCFGLAMKNTVQTSTVEFGAIGRDHVRNKAKDHALNIIIQGLMTF